MNSPSRTPKKTPKKKRAAPTVKPVVDSSDDESEDEMPSSVAIDTTLGILDTTSNDGDGWTTDDDTELVKKVKSTCKSNDKVNYKTRLNQLDWSSIAFKKYSANECEQRFKKHLKNVRRHRILSEIVADVETNIKKCPIKKPLNAYQIFIQDQLTKQTTSGDFSETMRNLGTRFAELSPEERAVYERKAVQLKMEYLERKAAYESGNMKALETENKPNQANNKVKTPFMLYLEDAQANNGIVDSNKLREQYAKLSFDEKYKYVVKAVSLAPDVSQTTLLNKEERRIFKGQVRTAPTAYSLFLKEMFPKIKDKCEGKNIFNEVAKKWKTLDQSKRKVYMEAANIMKEKVKLEQEQFNERHGVTPNKKRRRQSTYIEHNTEKDDHIKELFPTPKPPPTKKRKESTSSQSDSDLDNDDIDNIQIKSEPKSPAQQTKSIPMTILHTTLESPEKGQRQKRNSEASCSDIDPMTFVQTSLGSPKKGQRQKQNSETNDSSQDHLDNGIADVSTTSSTAKKKSKKEKKDKNDAKSQEVPPPSAKPPSSLLQYFALHVHTGKPRKAQKAFDKLTKKERKQLNAEYNEKVEKYLGELKLYLNSLSKEEAKAYVQKIKETENEEFVADEAGTSQSETEHSQVY